MPKARRKKIPDAVRDEVLKRCRRQCCMCFGLNRKSDVTDGQIAHLDRDPSNVEIENLVYLCLECHKIYDRQSNRAIGYKPGEIQHYRDQLYRALGYDFVEWTLTLRGHRSRYEEIKSVVTEAHARLKECDPNMSVNEGPAD